MPSIHPEPGAVIFLRARVLNADGPDRAAEEADIARQRAACQTVAAQLEATVVREYVEYGGTGQISRRPVVQHLLDELSALHDARFVIITTLDRLTRKHSETQTLEQRISGAGASLITAADPWHIYLGTPMKPEPPPDSSSPNRKDSDQKGTMHE